MGRSDIEIDTFSFEKKYQSFLNRLYESDGFEIQRCQGSENKKHDLILSKDGQKYYIEEKGASYLHECMVVELVQDFPSLNWGWFFETECSHIVYAYYQRVSNEIPEYVYVVLFNKLKPYVLKNIGTEEFNIGVTRKHYGLTLNAYPYWIKLFDLGIVDILYRHEEGFERPLWRLRSNAR